MAQYKYREHVTQNNGAVFDIRHAPGTGVSNSGIYQCVVCGEEVTAVKGTRLPPMEHHTHEPKQPAVQWRLLVYAEERPKK